MEFLSLSASRHWPVDEGSYRVITDLCIMEPEPVANELIVSEVYPGVAPDRIREATAWPVRFARNVAETAPPSAGELEELRELYRRTERARGATT